MFTNNKWSIKCLSGARKLAVKTGKKITTLEILKFSHFKTGDKDVPVASIRLDADGVFLLLNQLLRDIPFVMNTQEQALALVKTGSPIPVSDLHRWSRSHDERQLAACSRAWTAKFLQSYIESTDNDSLLELLNYLGNKISNSDHQRVLRQMQNAALLQIDLTKKEIEDVEYENHNHFGEVTRVPVIDINKFTRDGEFKS